MLLIGTTTIDMGTCQLANRASQLSKHTLRTCWHGMHTFFATLWKNLVREFLWFALLSQMPHCRSFVCLAGSLVAITADNICGAKCTSTVNSNFLSSEDEGLLKTEKILETGDRRPQQIPRIMRSSFVVVVLAVGFALMLCYRLIKTQLGDHRGETPGRKLAAGGGNTCSVS